MVNVLDVVMYIVLIYILKSILINYQYQYFLHVAAMLQT